MLQVPTRFGEEPLYTSESRALAMLEILVHVDESELPPNMFIMTIEIKDPPAIYEVMIQDLPADWRLPENIALKTMGDEILRDNHHLGIKSAIGSDAR